jgi:hypothetical protein
MTSATVIGVPSQHFRRSDAVMFEVSGDRAVLLSSAGDELITLNVVGTLVWIALDEPSTQADVVERLRHRFDLVPSDQLALDVERFFDELAAADLIVSDAVG